MPKLVPVGKVSKLFGLEGEVLLNLYDTFPDEINIEEPLFVSIDSLTVPLFIDRFQRRGRRGALALFADIDTEKRVAELIGMELLMPGGEQPDEREEGEVYMEDLMGYTARIVGHDVTGTIDSYVDHEHNPLFVVMIGDAEVLVPAVDELIAGVDPTKREVVFSLPEGLLDLYLG